jgi:hypothetical protein
MYSYWKLYDSSTSLYTMGLKNFSPFDFISHNAILAMYNAFEELLLHLKKAMWKIILS